MILTINEFDKLNLELKIWDRIFLYWDLWAWKTTLSKYILNKILKVKKEVTSPTYTYYNKYEVFFDDRKINIYHFDLYRLENYEEFFNIWGEDIFDDEENIILVEWPEIIEKYYKATLKIEIFKLNDEDKRNINILKINK
jgi:tRNA threonylcarbamoyladenosine biosynthesis protein TsaE